MRKKVRNNKTILASILALGCLTAASVGFSSWVIAAQNTYADSNVNVTVANIEDHRFNVKASSDSKIKLGPSTKGPYISCSGSESEEHLNFNFKLTFTTNGSEAGSEEFNFMSLGDQSFNIKFSFTDTLNINDNVNEYIKFPSEPSETTIGTISKSGFSRSSGVTATQNNNEITYNGTLAWGSYFGGQNPSKLDESTVSKDTTKVDSYITGLNHLKECLKDNAAFKIKVNIDKAV